MFIRETMGEPGRNGSGLGGHFRDDLGDDGEACLGVRNPFGKRSNSVVWLADPVSLACIRKRGRGEGQAGKPVLPLVFPRINDRFVSRSGSPEEKNRSLAKCTLPTALRNSIIDHCPIAGLWFDGSACCPRSFTRAQHHNVYPSPSPIVYPPCWAKSLRQILPGLRVAFESRPRPIDRPMQ